MKRFQFIHAQRHTYAVRRLCQVLEVAPSGYYAWRQRPPSARAQANAALEDQITAIYHASRQTYGSPRVQAELRAQGVGCNHKRVERLRRQLRLRSVVRRRHRRTAPAPGPVADVPNRLNRDFRALAPNQKWLTDITVIPTREGKLYLAVVLDLFARRIVGWQLSAHGDEQLVREALHMAVVHRHPRRGELLHHSDQGAVYTAADYGQDLAALQATLSRSRRGNCLDNAPVESFFATLKTELTHRTRFLTRAQARTDIVDYLETFYNRTRRHSSLNYWSPIDFEPRFAD